MMIMASYLFVSDNKKEIGKKINSKKMNGLSFSKSLFQNLFLAK